MSIASYRCIYIDADTSNDTSYLLFTKLNLYKKNVFEILWNFVFMFQM